MGVLRQRQRRQAAVPARRACRGSGAADEGLDGATLPQRGPAEAEITLNGQSLGGDDVWCEIESVKRGGGAVSLVLHLRGVTVETEEVLSQAALILLDNAIGEYDSVMRVAEIDLALLEGKPKRSDRFFPLRDLPAFLDRTREG